MAEIANYHKLSSIMPDFKKSSIAIVDDDASYRKILYFLAKKNNFSVVFEAENGADCIQQLKDSKKLPDLIIMDIEMPIMDGYEATRLVKTYWPKIKILGHSSIQDPQALAAILKNGADQFLSKGMQHAVLGEIVREVLDR